jgi:hypothetical protein
MSDPVRWCPGCEYIVELELTPQGMYKCKNCWRHYKALTDLPRQPQRRMTDAATPTN